MVAFARGCHSVSWPGAKKIVILETDGMANQASSASFTGAGAYQSYYNVGSLGTATASGSDPATSCENVATNICALDSANPPGYAQPQRPVEIDCIAFGAIFEPTAAGWSRQAQFHFSRRFPVLAAPHSPVPPAILTMVTSGVSAP